MSPIAKISAALSYDATEVAIMTSLSLAYALAARKYEVCDIEATSASDSDTLLQTVKPNRK